MRKIGVLFGMENTFPGALVERINSMKVPEIHAEFLKVGAVKMAEPSGYRLIVDRISQDIAFYRSYLKNAALNGTLVIDNPFWWRSRDFPLCMPTRRFWLSFTWRSMNSTLV